MNVAIQITKRSAVLDHAVLEDNLFIFKNKFPRGGKRNLYTHELRQVIVERAGKEPLVLVTNLMDTPAEIVSNLYKERWGIELFFKWIKQNLRIKKFLGKSENAVKTQIAIALILYLLIAIFNIHKKSLYYMHQLLIWINHNWALTKSDYRLIKPPNYKYIKLTFGKGYSNADL